MTNIVAIRDLIKWYFSSIPFVTADPADIDKHFAGYNYNEFDALAKEETSEVFISLRKNQTAPLSGSIRQTGTAQQENLSIDVYCVKTVGKEDWEGQITAQEECKQTLLDFEIWLNQTTYGANSCDFPLLKYINLDNVPHGAVETFGQPEAYGWYMRLIFQEYLPSSISFNPLTAPPVWDIPEGSIAIFTDGKWTYTQSPIGFAPITFFAEAGKNDYTADDVPELAFMVGKAPKVVGLDSTNLTPAKRGWDNTTFSISSDITLDGTEFISIIYG